MAESKDVATTIDSESLAAREQEPFKLTSAPILAYPNFEREFLLETDASGVGLGALLQQQQNDGSLRPLAYASRTLQAHEQNYGITELEALGVVWAVRHFRDTVAQFILIMKL